MPNLTIRLPDRQYAKLEAKVENGEYVNMSEAVRDAIRRLDSDEI